MPRASGSAAQPGASGGEQGEGRTARKDRSDWESWYAARRLAARLGGVEGVLPGDGRRTGCYRPRPRRAEGGGFAAGGVPWPDPSMPGRVAVALVTPPAGNPSSFLELAGVPLAFPAHLE